MKKYDVIIIGAGSVGLPLSIELKKRKLNILVIDELPSPGQGQNKTAIGGIRATHSYFSKIKTCQRSIDIFNSWKETHGDDIGWIQGGYSLVAYDKDTAETLKDTVNIQKSMGLNIKWLDEDQLLKKIKYLNPNDLAGGTYSPEDGHLSPLLTMGSFFRQAKDHDVNFIFNEKVIKFEIYKNKIRSVVTDNDTYYADIIINA